MCILMGLLAELLTRTYHESQDKPIYAVGVTRNVDVAAVVPISGSRLSAVRPRPGEVRPEPGSPREEQKS